MLAENGQSDEKDELKGVYEVARGRAANGSGLQPRKRADGRYEARCVTGIDPLTGKAKYKYIYGKTSDECARKLRAAVAAVDAGTYIEPKRMKLSEWLDIWLEDYCGAIKPGTLKCYTDDVRNHIAPALGTIRLCELQPHDVQRFINNLQRGAKSLSPKTIKNIHGVLCKALSEACRVKYIPSNPASGCVLPKVIREELHPFESDEIRAFMQAMQGSPSEALFFFALKTGMRLSEILGLRWSRVDFQKNTIKVDAQLLVKRGKNTARELGTPKNGKPRSFIAANAVMECLRSVKKQQNEWRLRAGQAWDNPLDLVFTNEIGQAIPHATVEHRFTRILQAVGIENHRFHDLRHTFTVESIRAGVDVKTLSSMLGHSSVSFTLDVYAHATTEMQVDAAEKLQALIVGRDS